MDGQTQFGMPTKSGPSKYGHLDFRMHGNASAKKRAENLNTWIEDLKKKEASFKEDLSLLLKDRSRLKAAEDSQFQLQMLQKDMDHNLQGLCAKLKEQFSDIRIALEDIVVATSCNDRGTVTTQPTETENNLAKCTKKFEDAQIEVKKLALERKILLHDQRQLAKDFKNWQEMWQSELEKEIASKAKIEEKLKNLESELGNPQSNSYTGQKPRGHKEDGNWDTDVQADGEAVDQAEGSRDGDPRKDQVLNPGKGISSPEITEQEGQLARCMEYLERLKKDQEKSKGKHASGETGLLKKLEANEKNIKKKEDDVNKWQDLKQSLERELKDEEAKSLDREHLEQHQGEEAQRQKEELEELNRESRRRTALSKVRDDPELRREGSFHDSFSPFRRLRNLTGKAKYGAETDSSRHFNVLQEMMDNLDKLEQHVGKIRRLRETVDSTVDLCFVLEREYAFEGMWLCHIGQPTLTTLSGPATEGQDHFSRDIPKDLYGESPKGGQIRLLKVLRASDPCLPLLCTLEVQTLDSNPTYEAISYVWGSEHRNGRLHVVELDVAKDLEDNPGSWGTAAKYARRIPIRNNLFRALLRLRRPDEARILWVDVMCINQFNMAEKSDQLGQMFEVYSKAKNVCVWLGESDDDGRSDKAMRFIQAIMDFAVLDTYIKDQKHAEMWYALSELMRDRWFSRRWVVQEIALALDKATLHCGGETVPWSDFADAVSLLVTNQDVIKRLFAYEEWREGPNTLGDVQSFGGYILLEAISRLFLTTTPTGTASVEITKPIKRLESLVTSLKTFDSSDPRDLIYSLVSIASDANPRDNSEGATRRLQIDYNKPSIQVYRDFTKFCILSSESLDIICRPWAMPINEEQLPSWIPCLSTSEFGEPEKVYSGRKNGDNLVGPVDHPYYNASGEHRYDVQGYIEDSNWKGPLSCKIRQNDNPTLADRIILSKDIGNPISGSTLIVKGFKLAEVENVSARNTGGVILRESLAMAGWMGWKENTTRVPDQIWRTLVADRDAEGRHPPVWYQRACLRCLEVADKYNNGDLNVGELLQGHSDILRKYLTRVRNVTWNRVFFTTAAKPSVPVGESAGENNEENEKNHALFGLGPPNMLEGDFVCILFGCSVPVILRKSEEMKFVGAAYLYGKMDGEANDDLQKKKAYDVEEQVFELS